MTGPVICPYCSAPTYTDNSVWVNCSSCGERVWIDFDHPEAPPKIAVQKRVEAMRP